MWMSYVSGPFKKTLESEKGWGSWISEEDVARANNIQTNGQLLVLAAKTEKIPQISFCDVSKDEVGDVKETFCTIAAQVWTAGAINPTPM